MKEQQQSKSIINEKYAESELTGKIIGCCMEVHRFLGNGFQEVIYQRALAIEFKRQNIAFSREHEMDIIYKGENIGTGRVDFFVEGKVMVELKAIIHWRMFTWRRQSTTWKHIKWKLAC